jgi:hypothetical protein
MSASGEPSVRLGVEPPADIPIDEQLISADEFAEAYGERLEQTLDLDTWETGPNLAGLYESLTAQVAQAVRDEREALNFVRQEVFPRLAQQPDIPELAGVYRVNVEDIARAHLGVLFNGELEACDGTVVDHDTLVLTVTQIGVCLVSYQGEQRTLSQRLFRKDLHVGQGTDGRRRVIELLQRRRARSAVGVEDRREMVSELARRGIMAYAERAVLLRCSDAAWRMGHGPFAPYELLTGSGHMGLLEASADVLRGLHAHERFVFVPSAIRDRFLLTLGDALGPLEYVIAESAYNTMKSVVANGHYSRGKRTDGRDYFRFADDLVEDIGRDIVLGAFRASAVSPPQAFFAHRACAHQAALVAMADSVLQEHRGFPMLIDIADRVAATTFGAETFNESVRSAYADAGEPFRYLPERKTRR